MAVTLPSGPHNISYASNACRQSLEDCLTITSLIKNAWAENRLAEFNLWAAGVGASAVKQRNSLDKRLAVETDVRDVVTNLLITLKAFIEECKKLGLQEDDCGEVIEFDCGINPETEIFSAEEPIQRSFSPWSDSSVSDSEIEKEDPIPPSNVLLTQAMKSTEVILDQLARLAVAIRRSGISSRLQKADRLFDPEHHEDLQNHLVLILSANLSEIEKKRQEIWDFNAKDISRNFNADITQLSTAQQHLINANLRRRNRFIYAQRHARKLASIQHFSTQEPVPKLETVNQPNRGPNIVLGGSKARLSSPETKLVSAASPLSTTRSEATQITDTTVSAVATSVRFNISAPSTVMSQVTSTGSKARYPNPPHLENLNSFKCPCCCLTLPVTFSEHDRWRKHIAQDLCPYTCYLNDCPRREVLYITRESWMNHIEKEHPCPSYWECFACDTAEKFDTAEMFIAHVKEHQSISESHFPTLIDVCLRKTPHITSCPLCHWAEDQVEDLDYKALFDHVAEHIHSFSLLSLPWAEAADGNEKARFDSSVEKVRDWFATNFPTMVVEEEHEPSIDVTYNIWNDDDYFKQNDYFAGSSQRSGVAQNESHSLEGIANWTLGLGSSSGSKSESIIESQSESLCDQEEFPLDIACRALDGKENAWGSDIVALFTLVVKLYNDVYVPAREAPKFRRELIKELAILKDVLSTLADDAKSKIFQQRLGESRKRALNRCLLNLQGTLAKLDRLVEKHRNPRSSLWGGVKWVGTMGETKELKSRIAVYSAQLKLYLSPIGDSTLVILESSLELALSRIPKVHSDAEDEADILNPNSQTISKSKDSEGDRKSADVPGLAGKEQSPDELVRVSDIVALCTLVVKLYNDVYVPAREAPKFHRELIKELAGLRDVLSTLEDHAKSKIFQQRLGDSRKRALNSCILNLRDTLTKLDRLVEKHRSGLWSVWGGVKWVGTMGEVRELKSRIAVYSAQLNLCLSSIANSTLERLERALELALSRIPKVPSDDEDEADILNPNSQTISESKEPEGDRKSADVPGLAGKEQSPDELVAEVIKILREKQAFYRPLRHDPPRIKNHQPNKVLSEVFEKHVDDKLKRYSLNTFTSKKWLRLSTWWLLKAKHARQECERSEIDDSLSIPFYGKSTANQAYVDVLKASWILDKHILKGDPNLHSLLIDENYKLAQDLIDAISDESSLYKSIDTSEKADLLEQNHYIIDEEQFCSDDISTAWMDEGRWITVEKDDAGEEDEKVLFRTFVNAAIGSKKHRIKSKGAPYMLLLYTKKGESEIQVTMISQSGSCGLNLIFTNDDLQKCDGTTSSSSHQSTLPESIELNFNGVKTEITFTNERDLKEFSRIPRSYFQAVRRREPQQLAEAAEMVIFQRSVKSFQRLNASTLRPLASEQEFESCDLRVLETTPKQAWETVRRIVISSSAGEKQHWCKEFFLPLSGVQMKRESNNQYAAKVKWSDCTYEKISMDGNYNKTYSYIYKETAPNRALSLCFRGLADANAFETTILRLNSTPIFSWPSTINPTHFVYTVSDTGEHAMAYRAILIIRTRSEWSHSALSYVYRDTDFQYARETDRFRLQFHQAYYTHYVSNHFGHTFLPRELPHFKECEKRLCNEKYDSLDDGLIEFDDEMDCLRFLSSLSSGHRMIFSRQASFISTRLPSRFRFGAIDSKKGPADVQLWQRGTSVRLVTRWVHGVEDKWMSLTVPAYGMDRLGGNYRAILPMVEYQRGRKVNMSNMEATDPGNRTHGKKSGPIIIGFGTANEDMVTDESDFLLAIDSARNPVLNPFTKELDSQRSNTSLGPAPDR